MAYILVADDYDLLREALKELLEAGGHRVDTVPDGTDAIREFHAAQQAFQPYDLVITDLQMNGLDGDKVIRRVRELAATPVILMTGQSLDKNRQEEIGASRILQKPVSGSVILQEVDGLLHLRQRKTHGHGHDHDEDLSRMGRMGVITAVVLLGIVVAAMALAGVGAYKVVVYLIGEGRLAMLAAGTAAAGLPAVLLFLLWGFLGFGKDSLRTQ